MEADGSVEFLGVHHCVAPNEKYGFIAKDFAKATAEHRCFISRLSHHPCSRFKSIVFGEAIRMRRLNERDEDYQSALVRLRNKTLRSDFSQNMVQDMRTWCATADNDKAALLKHSCNYQDLTQKTPISQCFKVTFVKQPKASYLEECEDKYFHKIDAEINIKKTILPHSK